MTEIRKARKVELKEKRRKLFPIRLANYERIPYSNICIIIKDAEAASDKLVGKLLYEFHVVSGIAYESIVFFCHNLVSRRGLTLELSCRPRAASSLNCSKELENHAIERSA